MGQTEAVKLTFGKNYRATKRFDAIAPGFATSSLSKADHIVVCNPVLLPK
ncbi:hypothetical protein [Anabaena sp. CCY 9910]